MFLATTAPVTTFYTYLQVTRGSPDHGEQMDITPETITMLAEMVVDAIEQPQGPHPGFKKRLGAVLTVLG
jgi:hypothetical protein